MRYYAYIGFMSKLFSMLIAPLALCLSATHIAQSETDNAIDIHHCDNLASDALNPDSVTTPIADENLQARIAIKACSLAIKEHPEILRFRFQLARSYIADGKVAVGAGLMGALADQGYPIALFKLGQAHYLGQGATLNHRLALKWYKRAFNAGIYEAANNLSILYADPISPLFDIDNSLKWAEAYSEKLTTTTTDKSL